MLAQVAEIVGVVEILELGWVASEFLVVGANGARILHSTVDHFCFLVALDLKFNWDNRGEGEYAHQSNHDQ